MKKKIRLETLTCPSCVVKIEKAVGGMDGVNQVKVGFNTSTVKVDFDEENTKVKEIENRIEKLGYQVK